MKKHFIIAAILSLFIVYLMVFKYDIPLIPSISIPLLFFYGIWFVKNSGSSIAFREIAMFVACLQLLFTSLIAFYVQLPDPIFLPLGNPDEYFDYAIPGVLAFGLGLFTLKNHININDIKENLKRYKLLAISKQLIVISYISLLVNFIVPSSLKYFVVLVSFFSLVAACMLLFANIPKNKKWFYIFLALLPILTNALAQGIFYLVLVFGAFIVIYYFLAEKFKFSTRFAIILVGLLFVFILDTTKREYRSTIGPENSGFIERITSLGSLLIKNFDPEVLSSEDNISGRVTRANQGALVTWVMNYVPDKEPYAKGSTIIDAVSAGLFPRFLYAGKAQAGGHENFQRFTGRELIGTSMNIGLLGEGWANFGYWGGIIFMFGVGLFYCIIFKLLIMRMKKDPLIFFWIPYFLMFTIKAEDDLVTPMNHIIKSLLVYFIFYHLYFKKNFVKKIEVA